MGFAFTPTWQPTITASAWCRCTFPVVQSGTLPCFFFCAWCKLPIHPPPVINTTTTEGPPWQS